MRVATWCSVVVGLGFVLGACGDETKKRPLGATCTENDQCVGGVCGGGLCLDPSVDTDQDGLINRVEAGLETDPVDTDTDGDGVPDGTETGPNPDAPLDTDGDGRIDARESIQADCDRDELVDQLDATDGLDADGTCPGSVVISPCQDLCDRASEMSCPNTTGCLTSCSEAFTAMNDDCRTKFAALGTCAAEGPQTGCAETEGGAPAWQLGVSEIDCAAEMSAFEGCLGTGIVCPVPDLLQIDVNTTGTLEDDLSLLAYTTTLEVDFDYELTVRIVTSTDDPSVAAFASLDDLCAWLADPVSGPQPIGVSDNEAGFDEVIQLGASTTRRTIVVLVVNARESGPTSFTISVNQLGS